MLKEYSEAFGLRSVSLRYFNAAGTVSEGEIDDRHEPETHLISLALRGAGNPDYTLKILVDDYGSGDGSAIRDYIHVIDLADAHLPALEYLSSGGETTRINLGSGDGTSVKAIRDSVQRITGKPVNSEIAARRPSDPANLVSVPKKAERLLGWTPTNSKVDRLISDAWKWYQTDC